MENKSTQETRQTTRRKPTGPSADLVDTSIGGVQSFLDNPNSSAVYSGPRVAGMSDYTTDGLSRLTQSGQQSRGYFDSVLNGDYTSAGNPHQAALDDSIVASVMPRVNNQFSAAGMTGGTMHQGTLTKELTRGLAAPRYQNYQFERGLQNAAAGDLINLDQLQGQNYLTAGGIDQAQRQAEIDAGRQQFEDERTAELRPQLEAAGLVNMLGNMYGQTDSHGTTTASSKPSIGSMIAGGTMMGAGLLGGGSGFGGIVPGISGLFGSGLRGFQQGYSGMHSPDFWNGNQTVTRA